MVYPWRLDIVPCMFLEFIFSSFNVHIFLTFQSLNSQSFADLLCQLVELHGLKANFSTLFKHRSGNMKTNSLANTDHTPKRLKNGSADAVCFCSFLTFTSDPAAVLQAYITEFTLTVSGGGARNGAAGKATSATRGLFCLFSQFSLVKYTGSASDSEEALSLPGDSDWQPPPWRRARAGV